MMQRAVIYCRCSTEEESQADALRKQVLEAEACVYENKWVLVDRYVESKSGTTAKGRQEYRRLFEDIESDRFDVIVIKSQDRLMRNTKDWYLFLDRLQRQGKRLYLYLDRKFYSSDDSLIAGVKAILAEEYSRELSKKIVNAHRHRQKNGGRIMLTNKVFGFLKESDGGVSIVEEEAEVIRKIYVWCASGYGSRTIETILRKEGIKSRYGNDISAAAIRRMIKNPLYKGIFVMNRRHFNFETKQTVKNPEEEWIYNEKMIPAIVDERLWERANQAMSLRAGKYRRKGVYPWGSNPGKYALSGKLVCGVCGNPYYRTRRRAGADGRRIYEWKCSEYLVSGRRGEKSRASRRKAETDELHSGCNNSHLDEGILFALLEKMGEACFQMEEGEKSRIIQTTIRLLEKVLKENPGEKRLSTLEGQETALIHRKQLLMDKLLGGIISDSDYNMQNGRIEKQLLDIREEKQRIQENAIEQETVKKRLDEIRRRLENGGLERAFAGRLAEYIRKIVVHEWKLEIQLEPIRTMGITFLEETDVSCPLFIDYPFPPNTEKGRFLDRQKIMAIIKENPGITVKRLAAQMGRSPGMVRSRMAELTKGEYIRFCGRGGHGIWELLKELPEGGSG